jgi:hypothetical protein
MSRTLLVDWSRLDTFDELTDRYKHLRTAGQMRRLLDGLAGTEVSVTRRPHQGVVEARCRKPATTHPTA